MKTTILDVITLILAISYLIFIIFERIYHLWLRKFYKCVILVNGIRGKSTVCRLIDAGLRNCGFRVYTKITGTIPTIIDENNQESTIKRLGNANIREQLKVMRKARKSGVDVLVIECMAVTPELQEIVQQKMVNANIVVVTNVREDHIGEMGDTLEELAMAFAKTLPVNGKFIINNADYLDIYQTANLGSTEIIIANDYQIPNCSEIFETFPDNINLALSVCDSLNLSREKFLNGMKNYHHDFGAFQIIKRENTYLVSAFSANDVTSTKLLFLETLKKFEKKRITILFNSRGDRPNRTNQFVDFITELQVPKIILDGENINYVKRKLWKAGNTNVSVLKCKSDLLKEDVIFGIGNIKDTGFDLINYFNGELKDD